MSNVKKVYEPLIALLEANSNKSIKTIMPEIMQLVMSKQMDHTFKRNEDGVVTHVFCYYHKAWEDVTEHEYSPKKTASGLNSMCKIGNNQWAKQQRDYKKTKESILDQVSAGTLAPHEIEDALAKAEEVRQQIVS